MGIYILEVTVEYRGFQDATPCLLCLKNIPTKKKTYITVVLDMEENYSATFIIRTFVFPQCMLYCRNGDKTNLVYISEDYYKFIA